jgi:hypothetical protein
MEQEPNNSQERLTDARCGKCHAQLTVEEVKIKRCHSCGGAPVLPRRVHPFWQGAVWSLYVTVGVICYALGAAAAYAFLSLFGLGGG